VLCQRPYSITTRIKTKKMRVSTLVGNCQRPYSITTRIKTPGLSTVAFSAIVVRDHIPLQQGLRLNV